MGDTPRSRLQPADRCGVNRDGLQELKQIPGAEQAVRTIGYVVIVLLCAAAFELAKLPEPVILVILAVAALGLLQLRFGVHVARTAQGLALVYTRRVGGAYVRVLRQGGVYQSATYVGLRCMEPVFAYHRAFDRAFDLVSVPEGRPLTALALGGGGYAWPKHALVGHPELKMDVVEIDPAVTKVARRWFYLEDLERFVGSVEGSCVAASAGEGAGGAAAAPAAGEGAGLADGPAAAPMAGEGAGLADGPATAPAAGTAPARAVPASRPRLGLITADARAYLEDADAPRYDIIVNDVFRGAEPVFALATVEAARAVLAHLAPNGAYLMNVVSTGDGADLSFLRDEVATLSCVFACVRIVPAEDEQFGGEDNYLVIASRRELAVSDAIPFDDDFLGAPLADSSAEPVFR